LRVKMSWFQVFCSCTISLYDARQKSFWFCSTSVFRLKTPNWDTAENS
jgi:hypothetical protein